MRVQNILSAIAISSILFVGCSKEATVEPKFANNDIEIYEMSTPGGGGDEDEWEDIRVKSTVKRKNNGIAIVGATVELSNTNAKWVAITDNNGVAQIDVPSEGIYTYTVIENGTIKFFEVVSLYKGVLSREDEIE